jgi:hypothetical protein
MPFNKNKLNPIGKNEFDYSKKNSKNFSNKDMLIYEDVYEPLSNKIKNHDDELKIDNNLNICLADFGTYCEINKQYSGSFGTRY